MKLKDSLVELKEIEPGHYEVTLSRQESILDFAKNLIEESGGDVYLMSINAIDYPEEGVIELRYLFWSIPLRAIVDVRTKVNRKQPRAKSLITIIPGAKPYEQEIYDLFGVVFEGNKWLRDGSFKPPDLGRTKPLLKQIREG